MTTLILVDGQQEMAKDIDMDELFMTIKESERQCYEALRKRRFRALDKGVSAQRYLGFAFLVGAYDAERYMWEKGFAMTPESILAIEQEFLFELGVVDYLKFRPVNLTYLDGVRKALEVAEYQLADEIELC